MSDRHQFFEDLVYHSIGHRRYTQESPVMPDVWIKYGMEPGRQQELLLVPNWHYTTADLAQALRDGLKAAEGDDEAMAVFRAAPKSGDPSTAWKPAAVAHNQNVVVATLWLDQVIRVLLPLSWWWQRRIAAVRQEGDEDQLASLNADELAAFILSEWADSEMDGNERVGADIIWLAQVVGLLAYLSRRDGRRRMSRITGEDEKVAKLGEILGKGSWEVDGEGRMGEREKLAAALGELTDGIPASAPDDPTPLYSVNINRQTVPALYDSLGAVKADATRRVFSVGGRGIRWAVIDSGIDARHVAFRHRDDAGQAKPEPFEKPRRGQWKNHTRVLKTYDFTRIRELLSWDPSKVAELERWFPILSEELWRDELKSILRQQEDRKRQNLKAIVWERLEPFLEIPHDGDYRPPQNRHGTHVAGIIGADWRTSDDPVAPRGEDLSGIAPEIELYDLRVLDGEGRGNEFGIMSALQFVRDLNNRKDFVAVHGVNLSFAIPHDVANYACGRTPVCDEATRMAGSGIIVVAAAGNAGRARYVTPSGTWDDGFRTVSITDPGNAEAAITVGATHRREPHKYGVSYFSSRGPTGDGRCKPDLVAPGEKIQSTVPGGKDARLDGTSMAAPHVSGAAALLLERNRELVNEPERVKEILCGTATDLGRERYFQGAGVLDILRALQSI